MTFHVGQKVICVDDSASTSDLERELKFGEVYIVAWSGTYDHPLWGRYAGVSVEGIIRNEPDHPELADIPFAARRFAPLVETKTDISVFTAMLTPTPQRRELVSSVNGEGINAR